MEVWERLFDILLLLSGALVLGALFERLKQSALLGYLIAGTLLGPHVLDFVKSREEVETLAELGVSLLLFSIGLEFSWDKLRKLRSAVGTGVLQVGLTTLVGLGLGRLLGLGTAEALVLGAIVSLSSTACVLRVLSERSQLDSVPGRNALGILLFQDVSVIPLALMVDFFSERNDDVTPWEHMLTVLGYGLLLVVGLVLLLRYFAPWFLGSRSVSRNRELSLLLAVVVGLGAAFASHSAGISPALGAFVAGLVLAGSPFAVQVRTDISGLKTLLITLFFGSMGMFANPAWMWEHWGQIATLVALIVVGKACVVWFAISVLTRSSRFGLSTGFFLSQTGEFSFLLAELGRSGPVSEHTFMLVVSATLMTLFLTPYLVRIGPFLEARVRRRVADSVAEDRPTAAHQTDAIVIGFGPSGQRAAEQIVHGGYSATIIDLNSRSIRRAIETGFEGLVGDSSHADILIKAGLEDSRLVVVTLPDPTAVEKTLQTIQSLNPDLSIVVRARYNLYRDRLRNFQIEAVVDEENEVGEKMGLAATQFLERTLVTTES